MKKFLIIAIVLVALSTSGCIKFKTANDASDTNGGVFKTVNMGNTWAQKVLIPTVTGQPKSFAGVNVSSFFMDPSDKGALYFGSVGNGMFYTYDGANNWQIAGSLEKATVKDVAIDPDSKCIIYTAIGNKVFKSIDCNRTWRQVYFDNDMKATVSAIAIDHYDTSNIYIAISRGDVVKSTNGGEGWNTVYRPKNYIKSIIIDSNDSRNVFLISNDKGIFRTKDGGESWNSMENLQNVLKEQKLGSNIRNLKIIKGSQGIMFAATQLGLLKTVDDGENWERIPIIPTEKKAVINDFDLDQKDYNKIFYVTNTTFYRSLDGGENWTTIKLPTSRYGMRLIVDPSDSNIIYMAVYKPEK